MNLILLLILWLPSTSANQRSPALTRPKVPAVQKKATPAPAAKEARAPKEVVLWDKWYGISLKVKPPMPFGYYNERATRREGKVYFQTDLWKSEEGFLNEEHYGGASLDDAALTPLFYNIRKNHRAIEMAIDGNVSSEGMLTFTTRNGRAEPEKVVKSLPPVAILSSFFSLWVWKNWTRFEEKKTISFQAILEDRLQNGSPTAYGTVRMDTPDDFAKKTGSYKFIVKFNDEDSVWWMKQSGETVRIDLLSGDALVETLTKEQAKKFLKKNPT